MTDRNRLQGMCTLGGFPARDGDTAALDEKRHFYTGPCYFPWRLISQYPLELMSATSGEIF